MTNDFGTLYLVATPIGNLGDFAPRAVEVLKQADLVLAEDTRTFRKLASRFDISTPVESCHEHNERRKTKELIERLQNGKVLALTSDAGTPLLSDPGYHLVNAAHKAGIPVRCIPGPSAITAALALSGFEPHRFIFEGFLPPKSGRRTEALRRALGSGATVIFFESPHRIVKTLAELVRQAPDVEVCVARELTKMHEECLRGSAAKIYAELAGRPAVKGELVLLLRAGSRARKGEIDKS